MLVVFITKINNCIIHTVMFKNITKKYYRIW